LLVLYKYTLVSLTHLKGLLHKKEVVNEKCYFLMFDQKHQLHFYLVIYRQTNVSCTPQYQVIIVIKYTYLEKITCTLLWESKVQLHQIVAFNWILSKVVIFDG
jgi:hypothetical protein